MKKEIDQMVQEVANAAAKECFRSEFQTDENLTYRQEGGLGMGIAQYSGYSGLKIMKIFRAALEDANFHDEAAQVQEMMDGNWTKGQQK